MEIQSKQKKDEILQLKLPVYIRHWLANNLSQELSFADNNWYTQRFHRTARFKSMIKVAHENVIKQWFRKFQQKTDETCLAFDNGKFG